MSSACDSVAAGGGLGQCRGGGRVLARSSLANVVIKRHQAILSSQHLGDGLVEYRRLWRSRRGIEPMSISRAVDPETGHSILTPAAVVDPCDGSIQGGRVRIFRHLDGDRHLQSWRQSPIGIPAHTLVDRSNWLYSWPSDGNTACQTRRR